MSVFIVGKHNPEKPLDCYPKRHLPWQLPWTAPSTFLHCPFSPNFFIFYYAILIHLTQGRITVWTNQVKGWPSCVLERMIEIGDEFRAATLQLGGVEGVVGGGVTLVVTVEEGEKGEAREGGFIKYLIYN